MDSSETPVTDGTSASVEGLEAQPSQRLRAKTDPVWGHAQEVEVVVDGKKKKWIRCMYCNELFKGGGIHRFKLHLAGEKGNVKQCQKCSAEVRYEMQQSMENFADRKRKCDEDLARVRASIDGAEESTQQVAATHRSIRANKGKAVAATSMSTTNRAADRFFLSRDQPGDQQTIKSMLQSQKARDRVDLIISKWFIDASIPFNATTSRYYQPMINAIAGVGTGYKGPNMWRMRGPLLAKNVEDTKKFAESYHKAWKESGCSIMADGWTDRKRRTLINFLVYCPKGTIFLKSVDATASSKTGDFLFKLFSDVVRFVGVENVVRFVTDNASNMVLAGKKLEDEFPSIYWSPCAAHCLNLILSKVVQSTVAHASKITRYLYNHCNPLFLRGSSLMEKRYFVQHQLALLLILLHCKVYSSKKMLVVPWLYQKSEHLPHVQKN